jgi:membrane fusion protein, copper/silver efflux system
VEQSPGVYETREVRVGAEAGGRLQLLSGLLAGERVVARANFVLDAESRLMETMMGMPGMPGMEGMDMGGMEMNGHHHH